MISENKILMSESTEKELYYFSTNSNKRKIKKANLLLFVLQVRIHNLYNFYNASFEQSNKNLSNSSGPPLICVKLPI